VQSSAHDGFARARLDYTLPSLAAGCQMLHNHPYSVFGSVQFAKLFRATRGNPNWDPPNRPLGTLVVFPIFGSIGCQVGGQTVRISPGSLIVMPPGEHEPIECLDEPCVYGAIETEPAGQAPHRRYRFVAGGLPFDRTHPVRRRMQTQQLLWVHQAVGVNSAIHRVLGPDAQVYPSDVGGFTLLICLKGEIDVTCIKGGHHATRTVQPGSRVGISPDFRLGIGNTTPDRQPASVLQFSFSTDSNAR